MITRFKLFEERIYSDTNLNDLPEMARDNYNKLKLKVGDPVRFKNLLKNKDFPGDLIFYIDWISLPDNIDGDIWYHIVDDTYIYQGLYQDFQLEELSDDEKAKLKYNI